MLAPIASALPYRSAFGSFYDYSRRLADVLWRTIGNMGYLYAPIENGRLGDVPITDATAVKVAFAQCPAGKVVIGGGYTISESPDIIVARLNGPLEETNTWWTVQAERMTGSSEWTLRAYAFCATATP